MGARELGIPAWISLHGGPAPAITDLAFLLQEREPLQGQHRPYSSLGYRPPAPETKIA